MNLIVTDVKIIKLDLAVKKQDKPDYAFENDRTDRILAETMCKIKSPIINRKLIIYDGIFKICFCILCDFYGCVDGN